MNRRLQGLILTLALAAGMALAAAVATLAIPLGHPEITCDGADC